MALKENYTDSEWAKLENSAFWVFNSVAAADGVIDKREVKAFKRVLQNFSEFGNDLTREVLSSAGLNFQEDNEYDLSKLGDALGEVAGILEKKAGKENCLIFKKTLIAIGIHVGNSSGAIFSSKFSDEEVDALKEVGTLLGVTEDELAISPSIKDIIKGIKN